MKKIALIAGALIALSASIASAQSGINLSWTDCGTFGTQNQTFACNTNTGSLVMVASYLPPSAPDLLAGISSAVLIQTDQTSVPPWWQFGNDAATGTIAGCRATNILPGFDFTSNTSCYDYYSSTGSAAAGALLATYGDPPNGGLVKVQAAVPFDLALALDPANGEYYAFKLTVQKLKTVNGCAGCSSVACMTLQDVTLYYTDNVITPITNPLSRNFITYNSATTGSTCPAATPTHSSTWGELKSLYR